MWHNCKWVRIVPAIITMFLMIAAILLIWRPYQYLRKTNQQQILLKNELKKQKENIELSHQAMLQLKKLKQQFSPLFNRPFSTKRSDQVIQYFLDIAQRDHCLLLKTDITLLKNKNNEGFPHRSQLTMSLTGGFFNLYLFLIQAAWSPWPFIVKKLVLFRPPDEAKNFDLNLTLQLEVLH